jgi:putative ABC transport system permease protein
MSGIRIGIWSDVRIALANARRAPGFTVTAICCLALGIAASGAVLTLFSAAILRPLPFPNEERLIRIWSEDPGRNLRAELSYPDIVDLREELTVLDLFAATARARSYFLTDDGARRVEGEAVTRYYFELLGITPFMGRLFSEAEFSREATPTMLLAYGTWNTAFGADPDIVGSIVRTERRDYTVIGVLPPGFYGTIEDDIPDLEFWVPMAQELEPDEFTRRDLAGIWTLGRLGPGVTIEQAQERVRAFGIRLSHAHPITRGPYGLRLERMGANWRENLRDQNYLLLIASGLLLGVATANVAGLLMTRTFDRRRELALRAALGAGHARIVREVFVETALLTVAGAAIGLALAPALLRTFLRIAPDEVPLYVDVSPDATALLAAAGVITLAAILATAAPAAVGLRVSPAQALRGGGRGATSARNERRAGAVLVAAEVAVSTIVIVAAGLLVRSYQSMTQIDLGYRTEGILRIAVFPTELDVPRVDQLPAFADRLRNTLLEEPGVDDVSLMWPTLPPSTGVSGRIRFDGMPDDLRNHGLNVDIRAVDPNFFPLMEIPLLAGRNVHTSDAPEAPPVVIVSESVARSMGGVDAAVGRVIQLDAVPLRVVGVVGDVIFTGPVDRRPSDLDIYRPLVQMPRRLISAGVSTRGDPRSLIAPLRARLLQLAPNSPLDWVSPLTVELADRMEGRMFYVVMLGAFAWSALLLTAVGIFAVLAHQVTRRAVEFGVRRALGARETRIVYEVMRRGIVVAVSGMGIGAVGAFLVARVLRTAVTDVAPFDIVTFGGSAVAIIVVTLIASYLPAARAARVAPVEALRAE